jgi:hypothetical protein
MSNTEYSSQLQTNIKRIFCQPSHSVGVKFVKLSSAQKHMYEDFFTFLSTFDIYIWPSGDDTTGGWSIAQAEWFRWLDLTMNMQVRLDTKTVRSDPVSQHDVVEFRPLIQDIYVDHIIDLVLFCVAGSEDKFVKPYKIDSVSNNIVFFISYKEILDRLMYVWLEYIYELNGGDCESF